MSKEQIKFSPLGALPHGWDIRSLKSVCTKIGSGSTPRGGKEVYLDERESHALIRSQNVFDHYFDKTGLVYISKEHVQELRNVEVQTQDLLLNITGDGITFARVCIVPEQVLPACVNQHVSIIRTNKNACIPGYLLGYLTLPSIKTYIEFFNSGGSRRAITKGNIESFEIPLPPLIIQNEIAKTIQSFNGKIENLRRQNETLEKIAQALFKHWFVDFEFPNAEGQPYKSSGGEMVSSELGDIPAGWRVGTLGDVTNTITKGTTPTTFKKQFQDSGINFLKAESITDQHSIDSSKLAYIDEKTNQLLKRSILQEKDIVYTIAGTIGRYAIVNESLLPANTNQAVAIIRPNINKVDPEYVLCYFSSRNYQHYLSSRVVQAVQANLSLGILSESPVIIPDKNIKEIFGRLVKPLFQKKENNQEHIQTLAKTRDTLLPKLMSGQLRIKP